MGTNVQPIVDFPKEAMVGARPRLGDADHERAVRMIFCFSKRVQWIAAAISHRNG